MPLTALEKLEEEARRLGLILDDTLLRPEDELDGLYVDPGEDSPKLILLNRHRPASVRCAALAEELGHHLATTGNVLRQDTALERKQELLGRAWAVRRVLPAERIRGLLRRGFFDFHDMAEELGVPVDFLLEAMDYYTRKGVSFAVTPSQ